MEEKDETQAPKKPREPKKPKPELQAFHNEIRQKLHDWHADLQESHGLEINFTKLADVINYKYHINTSAKILISMFSAPETADSRKLQLAEILALCQELKIPIMDLCKLPSRVVEDSTADSFVPWLRKMDGTSDDKAGVYAMMDPHYFGKYYVYAFQTKVRTPLGLGGKQKADGMPLREYELIIREKNGASFATMTSTDPGDKVVLEGQVFLLERSRQVYARLIDSSGLRVINIQFGYKRYSTTPMIYRTAAMLTASYNRSEAPLFCKLAIFRERQNLDDPEAENVIRGILTLDSREILVDEDAFEELKKQDKGYARMELRSKRYFVFHESDFADPSLSWDFETRVRRLLQLRRVSELAAQEVVQDSEDLSSFLMRLQKNTVENRKASE